VVNQAQIDKMTEALRSQGLTWSQTNYAVSLVRNAISQERERCAALCEGLSEVAEHSADGLRRTVSMSMAQSCATLIRAHV
jgi:hypothetical protein